MKTCKKCKGRGFLADGSPCKYCGGKVSVAGFSVEVEGHSALRVFSVLFGLVITITALLGLLSYLGVPITVTIWSVIAEIVLGSQ